MPDWPSHRFPFQKNLIVLGSVAAIALPSKPSIDDMFSRNSNTDLESFCVFGGPFPRSLSLNFTAVPSDSSLELAS